MELLEHRIVLVRILLFSAACTLALLPDAVCADEPAPKLDIYGDPLPDGAVARLGSIRLRHGDNCQCEFYPANDKLFSWGINEDMVQIWEIPSGKLLDTISRENSVPCTAAMSSDGTQLVVGWLTGVDDNLQVVFSHYDPESLRLKEEINAGPTRWLYIPTSRLCNDDQWLLACESESGKKRVVVRDLATGKTVRDYDSHAFDYCPATKTLLLLERVEDNPSAHFVRLLDIESGKARHKWWVNRATYQISSVALSEDGKRFAVAYVSMASGPGCVQIFNAESGHPESPPWRHEGGGQMRFFPGSEELLLVGRHDAGVWEATGRAVKHPFTPQSGGEPRRSLGAISPDGRWMAISTRNRIEIWDRRTWKRTIDGHAADCISELAVSPGGTVVATLALGNIIQIWEIPSGRSLARYQVHPLRIHNLAFTPDGKRLVFIEENEKDVDRSKVPKSERPPVLRVRDVFTGDVDREFKLRADVDRGFAVSPVEPLAAVCARKSVLLVDLTTGRLRSELQGAGDGEMAFSPDGGTLICDTSGRSEVWDVDSGVKLYEAAQIVTPTTRLAFSHAGNLLMPFAERNPVNKTSSLTIYETASGLVARTVVMPGSRSGRDSFAPAPSKVLGITKPYSVVLPIRNALSWTVSDIRARKSAGTPFRPWPGEYLCEVTSDGNYCMTMYIFSGGNRPVTVWRTPAEIRRGTRRDRELSEEELGRNWEQLHADPGAALDAFFTLVEGGKSTVDYLRQSLNPARPLDRKRVKELIAALDSDQFKERDAAKAELRIYRSHIEDELHAALESAQSLEVRDSVDHILRQPPDVLSQNRKEIAQIRSIFVLTSIGTDSARELIKHLATGAPEHRQTVYAQRALSFLQCQREQEQQSVR